MTHPDRPFLGIGLMFAFCILAPLADSVAKLIGFAVPILQLLIVRFMIQVALLWPVCKRAGTPMIWPRRIMGFVALRSFFHIFGIGAMFVAVRYLPIADAKAIAFVMPFILLIFGRVFLGEHAGWRRLAACIVGFSGTLLVMQPSFAIVGPAVLLPLLGAITFAFYILVTRRIAHETDPIALQVTGGALSLLMVIPAALLGAVLGLYEPVMPGGREVRLLLLLGCIGTASHLVVTFSLRFAPATTLAPMQYLEIPFAVLLGWLLFREFPNGLALLGIAVTLTAGLFIVYRERALSQARAQTEPPQAPLVARE